MNLFSTTTLVIGETRKVEIKFSSFLKRVQSFLHEECSFSLSKFFFIYRHGWLCCKQEKNYRFRVQLPTACRQFFFLQRYILPNISFKKRRIFIMSNLQITHFRTKQRVDKTFAQWLVNRVCHRKRSFALFKTPGMRK